VRVVVTGACGFIGSHVCEALLARGDTVVGLDNFNDFYDPRLKEENRALLERQPGFSLVRGSILEPGALGRALSPRPDVVVHLAAWAGVRPSIERPALYTRENIDGTVAVMDGLRALPDGAGALPRLVFASSSSVYGTNSKVPFEEDDPIAHPVSPYAATKRAGELLAYTYHHLYGLDVTCLRFFTVYGPRQRPEMAIHKFARLLLDGKAVPRYGDGSTRRDYTFIAEIVQGVLASIDRGAGFRIYNLGNSRTVTLSELIDKLAVALGVPARIDPQPEQPGDVPITFADVSRATRELDYRPDFPLERGLAEFAAWLKARP
jgi:UDP-glucuronate 4-epimerase